jgi:hypothetical protein
LRDSEAALDADSSTALVERKKEAPAVELEAGLADDQELKQHIALAVRRSLRLREARRSGVVDAKSSPSR